MIGEKVMLDICKVYSFFTDFMCICAGIGLNIHEILANGHYTNQKSISF